MSSWDHVLPHYLSYLTVGEINDLCVICLGNWAPTPITFCVLGHSSFLRAHCSVSTQTHCATGRLTICEVGYSVFGCSLPVLCFKASDSILRMHQRPVTRDWSTWQIFFWQHGSFCKTCLNGSYRL